MDAVRSASHPHEACGCCAYWRPEPRREATAGWGQCRRMPPSMPPVQDDKLVHVGMWPHTQATDWCGEWQPPDGAPRPDAATGVG